jgi:hypothetical protein
VTTGEIKRGRGRPPELDRAERLSVSVDYETMQAIDELAAAEQLTVAAVIRLLVSQALRQRAAGRRRRMEAKRSSGASGVAVSGR